MYWSDHAPPHFHALNCEHEALIEIATRYHQGQLTSPIFAPTAGVFSALRDRALFEQVRVKTGTPVWPGEIDLAPDAIYDGIRSNEGRVYRLVEIKPHP